MEPLRNAWTHTGVLPNPAAWIAASTLVLPRAWSTAAASSSSRTVSPRSRTRRSRTSYPWPAGNRVPLPQTDRMGLYRHVQDRRHHR